MFARDQIGGSPFPRRLTSGFHQSNKPIGLHTRKNLAVAPRPPIIALKRGHVTGKLSFKNVGVPAFVLHLGDADAAYHVFGEDLILRKAG